MLTQAHALTLSHTLTHPPTHTAALKERIGRLLAAVLPVATSGKERGSKGGGYTRSTTISIRSRPAEEQAAAQNGSKGGSNPAPVVMELVADPAAPAAAAYPNTLPAAAALFGTAEAVRYSHLLEQLQVGAWDGPGLGWAAT